MGGRGSRRAASRACANGSAGASPSLAVILLVISAIQIGATPTTKPASHIKELFTKLADRDPNVREQARIDLMGLTRSDLPALKEYVRAHRPLAPSQAAALREIVTHVYLAGEPYRTDEDHGFLGVSLSDGTLNGLITQQQQAQEADPTSAPPLGVTVTDRLPGLCAFRMLANGDVIVGIAEHSETPIRTASDLRGLITQARAGEKVTLEVFRGGRLITVPLVLSPRPDGVETIDFIRERQRRDEVSDEYWQQEFAPLVDDGVS